MLLAQRLRAGERCAADPECDPHWDDVVLLLHGDGTDGSTSFVDSSQSAHVLSASGSAQISSSEYLFGSSSISLVGAGSLVTAPDNNDFVLGTIPFTLELFFLAKTETGDIQALWSNGPAAFHSATIYLRSNKDIEFVIYGGAVLNGGSFVADKWTHVAVSFDGSIYKWFVDGVMMDSGTSGRHTTSDQFVLGNAWTDMTFDSCDYIDEIRITKGTARYTADFTPPTARFPNTGP